MRPPDEVAEAWPWGPYLRSVLRIVAAFMFILSGSMKLFGFPGGMPEGTTVPFLLQIWIGGVLEVFGGGLVLIGLFTRPVAFILSGMMAVAYGQFHFPQGFWPTQNGGIPAALYCLGMLEAGIGRHAIVQLQTLPGFTLPGDTAASARYFEEDLVDPPVEVSAEGRVAVPAGPGVGHAIVWPRVERASDLHETWSRP